MTAAATPVSKRLSAARQGLFVGRAQERAFFRAALEAPSWPCSVLHICGPGGVGKTSLLQDFAASCKEREIFVAAIDARHITPSSDAFVEALAVALGLNPSDSPIEFLARQARRCVVLVDVAELLLPLDAWLRESFLPGLPDSVLLVFAGRHRPHAAWSSDAGWGNLVRTLALRNLEPPESRNYLTKRKVPRSLHHSILDFTHGHPFALVLIADLFSQGGSLRFEPLESPDIVRALLERIVQDVPSAWHRQALEACAVVRVTTEPLLAAMLKIPHEANGHAAEESAAEGSTPSAGAVDACDLFRWLQGLSFMESGRSGISPHDLAREVLDTELRWRNSDRHGELLERASAYYDGKLQHTTGREQRALLHNHVFLHRNSPAVRPFFDWQEVGHLVPEAAQKSELAALTTMTARFEGAESARLIANWFAWQPQSASVIRDAAGEIAGFTATLALHQASPEQIESDPATRMMWHHIQQHAPLQPGEGASLFRFWMAQDTYQNPSSTQSLMFLAIMQHLLTAPDLVFSAIVCADPLFWEPIFAYTDMARFPADFEVGGKSYGLYTHDWRVRPLQQWLAMLSSPHAADAGQSAPPQKNRPIVLSRPDFALEVRAALRRFQSPSALHVSPLLWSRLVALRAGDNATASERVTALQEMVREACEEIKASPREAKSYRALFHTYLHGASTQEQVAEELDLPFSTYRRHLAAGIARLVEILWQNEMDI